MVVEERWRHRVARATDRALVAWSGAALFAGLALIHLLAAFRVRRRPRARLRVAPLPAGPSLLVIPTALAGLQGRRRDAAGRVLAALRRTVMRHRSLSSSLGPVELMMPAGVEQHCS